LTTVAPVKFHQGICEGGRINEGTYAAFQPCIENMMLYELSQPVEGGQEKGGLFSCSKESFEADWCEHLQNVLDLSGDIAIGTEVEQLARELVPLLAKMRFGAVLMHLDAPHNMWWLTL